MTQLVSIAMIGREASQPVRLDVHIDDHGVCTLPSIAVADGEELEAAVRGWVRETYASGPTTTNWGEAVLRRVVELPGRADHQEDSTILYRVDVPAAGSLGECSASVPSLLSRWYAGEIRLEREVLALLENEPEHRAALGRLSEWPGLHLVHPAMAYFPLRTPTLPPATHTNAILLGAGDCLWVEPASGDPGEIERVVALDTEARARGLRPQAILLTHHHHDHVGGAVELRARLGLPIWAHAQTASRLPSVQVDRRLQEGEVLELDGSPRTVWEVIHTPGHAPGHLCFLERETGLMVVGDMVAGHGTILVEPEDGDMTQYLASLRRMAGLSPSRLVPAHGGVIDDAVARLQSYHEHRLAREEKVLSALKECSRVQRAMDLVPGAYPEVPEHIWPLAALSVEAHLMKLMQDGRVERDEEGWRFSGGA